jgi:hypothetical protein
MNGAEIVPRNVKSDGGFQVIQFLTKGVDESRKSSEMHTEVQIRPFNMVCGDVRGWRRHA